MFKKMKKAVVVYICITATLCGINQAGAIEVDVGEVVREGMVVAGIFFVSKEIADFFIGKMSSYSRADSSEKNDK
jgi:hypothetical protein